MKSNKAKKILGVLSRFVVVSICFYYNYYTSQYDTSMERTFSLVKMFLILLYTLFPKEGKFPNSIVEGIFSIFMQVEIYYDGFIGTIIAIAFLPESFQEILSQSNFSCFLIELFFSVLYIVSVCLSTGYDYERFNNCQKK